MRKKKCCFGCHKKEALASHKCGVCDDPVNKTDKSKISFNKDSTHYLTRGFCKGSRGEIIDSIGELEFKHLKLKIMNKRKVTKMEDAEAIRIMSKWTDSDGAPTLEAYIIHRIIDSSFNFDDF